MKLSVSAIGVTLENDVRGLVTLHYCKTRPRLLDAKGHLASVERLEAALVKNPTRALERKRVCSLERLEFAQMVLRRAKEGGMLSSAPSPAWTLAPRKRAVAPLVVN